MSVCHMSLLKGNVPLNLLSDLSHFSKASVKYAIQAAVIAQSLEHSAYDWKVDGSRLRGDLDTFGFSNYKINTKIRIYCKDSGQGYGILINPRNKLTRNALKFALAHPLLNLHNPLTLICTLWKKMYTKMDHP